MSRVEWLDGRRWASDTVLACAAELKLVGGPERVLKRLQMGKILKPADYASGVQEIIIIFEDAMHVKALEKPNIDETIRRQTQ